MMASLDRVVYLLDAYMNQLPGGLDTGIATPQQAVGV
jgi:hypothetical protein